MKLLLWDSDPHVGVPSVCRVPEKMGQERHLRPAEQRLPRLTAETGKIEEAPLLLRVRYFLGLPVCGRVARVVGSLLCC